MHRNLLLPCNRLPFGNPPTMVKQQKRMTDTVSENVNDGEEENEDECVYYYRLVVQPQVPVLDRTIESADMQKDSDQEMTLLNADRPQIEERPTNETEMQQDEYVMQVDDNQGEDEQPAERAQDEIPEPQYSGLGNGDRELGYQLSRRERRPSKIFTHDQLGTPACYSAAHANEMPYLCQPMPYRQVQSVKMWTNPFQVYQPLFMQRY